MAVEPKGPGVVSSAGAALGNSPIPLNRSIVAAFIGRTERGPLNEPVGIDSFSQFRRTFGGHCDYSLLSHALLHFFMQGGERALVVRVANRATRARIEIPTDGPALILQARRPGSHELLRASVDYDGVENLPSCFNLVVQQLLDGDSQQIQDQELFPALSVDPANRRFVVDVLKESQLVRPAGPVPATRPLATRASHPGQPIPYIEMTSPGSDGDELTDYDIIGSNSEGTGLFALDRAEPFDLLCIPPAPHVELGVTTFVAAERYCERRRALLIWDPPWSWSSAADAVAAARRFGRLSRNAMTYFPRIRRRGDGVRFPAGLPACGALAGALARDGAAGIWRLPQRVAALSAAFTTVGDVDVRTRSVLRRCGVNTLAVTDGRVTLHGDVTLAGSSAASSIWRSLHCRRLAFFVLSSIAEATTWVSERIDSPQVPAALEKQVRTFLRGLFDYGALAGQAAQHAFTVRAVSSEEPAVLLKVGFALRKSGELTGYEFRYTRAGVALSYAAGLEAEQLVG